jgi:transglutaminase-like putative cysteine protease
VRFTLAPLAALFLMPVVAGTDQPSPAWLHEASARPLPAYDEQVPAVVLLDERDVTVGADGGIRTVQRRVVKVLTREGREAAAADVMYGADAAKVRGLSGWLIRGTSVVRTFGKADVLDVALSDDDVYNESRAKIIQASDALEGDVFGSEAVVEERPTFAQDLWPFQGRLPAGVARYRLTLPAGWRAQGTVWSGSKAEAVITGQTYTWELRDLPAIRDEPSSPPATYGAPVLAVTYSWPRGAVPAARAFADWAEVARWYSELTETQADPSPALVAKAKELTRSARTEIEQMRAIARYVQAVNYISVQIGIGRFRPHVASDVLLKGYGDCKDKANLMRALLRAVGIEARLVLVRAGDPDFVREQPATPLQFNHCILAVSLKTPIDAVPVVEDRRLGPLLFFDPTDEHTTFGDLPDHEQGSLGLIADAGQDGLVRLPNLPRDSSLLERQVSAVLTPDGTLTATMRLTAAGQAGAAARRMLQRSGPDLSKAIETWLRTSVPAVGLTQIAPSDDPMSGRVRLDIEFRAASYAQLMQKRLLIFRPAILPGRDWTAGAGEWSLPAAIRTRPITLRAGAYSEVATVTLPEGFSVDEVPPAVTLDLPFGAYALSVEAKGSEIVFKRRLTVSRAVLPANDYQSVRGFFDKIRAAEQAPVVLVKN